MDEKHRKTAIPNDTPGYGRLAEQWLGQQFRLQVLQSAAGFYIGTLDEDGAPCTRESDRYWPDQDQAQTALEGRNWPQKPEP